VNQFLVGLYEQREEPVFKRHSIGVKLFFSFFFLLGGGGGGGGEEAGLGRRTQARPQSRTLLLVELVGRTTTLVVSDRVPCTWSDMDANLSMDNG